VEFDRHESYLNHLEEMQFALHEIRSFVVVKMFVLILWL